MMISIIILTIVAVVLLGEVRGGRRKASVLGIVVIAAGELTNLLPPFSFMGHVVFIGNLILFVGGVAAFFFVNKGTRIVYLLAGLLLCGVGVYFSRVYCDELPNEAARITVFCLCSALFSTVVFVAPLLSSMIAFLTSCPALFFLPFSLSDSAERFLGGFGGLSIVLLSSVAAYVFGKILTEIAYSRRITPRRMYETEASDEWLGKIEKAKKKK